MPSLWNRLFSGENTSASREPRERIGASEVPRKFGEEILQSTPARRGLVSCIRDRMTYLKREEMPELVDRMLARFALYVVDLPASESDHHSEPFGLLDHSLKVASEVAVGLAGSSFRISADPVVEYKERPAWVYAGMIAALAHDLGKALDIEVSLQGSAWDPLKESLGAFLHRMGKTESGRASWTFRPGRGLHGHEERNAEPLRLVLAPSAASYLGPCLDWIGELYIGETRDQAQRPLPEAARRIKELVGIADRGTSLEDAFKKRAEARAKRIKELPAPAPAPTPALELWTEAPPAQEPPVSLGDATPQAPAKPAPATTTPAATPESASRIEEPAEKPVPGRDPAEERRLVDHVVDPANLLNSMRHVIERAILPSNCKIALAYVKDDRTWIIVPSGLVRIANSMNLRWTRDTERRILASLRALPQVERSEDGDILWRITPHPNASFLSAIALRTRGFLPQAEVGKLKPWPFEIVIRRCDTGADEVEPTRLAS